MTSSKNRFFQKINKRLMVAALLPLCLFLVPWSPKENYDLPDEPLFEGSYAEQQPDFAGTVKVVTWNIKLSQNIATAIAELEEAAKLKHTDILLLQEMDEAGVEAIAQALKYNYVYFPASVNTHHSKNVGNAILSKWPISEPKKLLLPFENPVDQEKRIAVRALVTLGSREVLVYSVHTETIWLGQHKRQAQFDTVIEDVGDSDRYVIVGGDFNTAIPSNVAGLEKRFRQSGFERISVETGPTFQSKWLKLRLDHIFTKGLSTQRVETWADTQASDHLAVAATLSFEPELANEASMSREAEPCHKSGLVGTFGHAGAPQQAETQKSRVERSPVTPLPYEVGCQ
jgi:endonuclease/exonuclease/phosphatase family metal-dependent hydrolase